MENFSIMGKTRKRENEGAANMEYIVIGILVVVVLIVSAILFLKLRKGASGIVNDDTERREKKAETQSIPVDGEAAIQVEVLPAEALPDESELVEITDSRILAKISNLIPGLVQAGNVVNDAVQATQVNNEVLYRAIIPAGAKLADSKAMEGAVRGIYHGADGIRGHANLVAVETPKGMAVVANTVAATMGVASMVVGQYYMAQINTELGKINDGISKISNFQNDEYRGSVFSLITRVKNIADFQVEILENNELRHSEILQLGNLEGECTQLLGHANSTLVNYTDKKDLNYDNYEKELKEAHSWYMYQKALLDILYEISELRYTLYRGAASREKCVGVLRTYTAQVVETQERLADWHQTMIERLSIDISEGRRKRSGLDRVQHLVPGLFNDDQNFRSIEKDTAKMIKMQSTGGVYKGNTSDLYAKDVQLVSKGGKVYYLPTENADGGKE